MDEGYSAIPESFDSVLIPDNVVLKDFLRYDNSNSIWYYQNQPFSGQLVSFYPNGLKKELTNIWQGRRHQISQHWFSDGYLRVSATFKKGKLHGEKKLWSQEKDHSLIAQLNYKEGKAHGQQLMWYPSGELYKRLHLNNGKEEGIQQAFRKNGALYANYEAKNGRIYGLKKASLCYGLEEEELKPFQ